MYKKSVQIWIVFKLIMLHLCICDDNKVLNSDIDRITYNKNDKTLKNEQLDRNNAINHFNFDINKIKRSLVSLTTNINYITVVPNLNLTDVDNLKYLPDNLKYTRKNMDNLTDNDYGKVHNILIEDNTTEFYDNDTEICVGDVEYCNMTREDYLAMLHEYIFPNIFEWVLICIHAVVFIIGLIGNALVCIAVYRNHSMRTVTNYFIVNLAVADFMVILICLPPTVLWDVTETWFFGTAMCRIVLYFQSVSVTVLALTLTFISVDHWYAICFPLKFKETVGKTLSHTRISDKSVSVTVSVLTLTFISVDRWYAICFPLKFKSTTGRAKTAIVIIWLLSLIFNVPEFVVLQVEQKMPLRFDQQYFTQCTPSWSVESDLKWQIVKALFLYTFPLLLMTVAYCQIVRVLWRSDNIPGHTESHKLTAGQNNWSTATRRPGASIHANASTEGQLRSRRKAAKMLVAVVAMFAVCYFPVHLMSVLRVATDVQQTEVMSCIALLSHVLCYANSAVNPLIYNFMSGKFRREFHRSYFKCLCCCPPPSSPDRNGTSFAPLGSSRAGTTRTIVRRNDSCASYRLTHLSPSNHNSFNRDYIRNTNTNTSFIENVNGNRAPARIRDDSVSESATRFTLNTDISKD